MVANAGTIKPLQHGITLEDFKRMIVTFGKVIYSFRFSIKNFLIIVNFRYIYILFYFLSYRPFFTSLPLTTS